MFSAGRAQWLFSIKLFIAAMMAYALSVHLALAQSYWALVTCLVVMSPMSGAIQSKAVFRLAGTLCAGLVTLMLATLLINTAELFLAVTGLLAAGAFAWGVLDRTPRAYGFQLFGVTLMLIAIPGASQPGSLFDTAVARISEIGVGLFCCTVVDGIIAPRSLQPVLRGRITQWLGNMENWMSDVLRGNVPTSQAILDQQKSLADLTAFSQLTHQLRHDPMVSWWERQCAIAIQRRMIRLIPMLSFIGDHLAALEPVRRERSLAWLAQAWEELERQPREQPDGDDAPLYPQESSPGDVPRDWQDLVEANLRHLASRLLRSWHAVCQLGRSLEAPDELSHAQRQSVQAAVEFPLYPDFHMAGRVAIATLMAYGILAALWWATGWENGATAVLMGVVAIGFFGGLDEAGKAIGMFGKFCLLSMLVAAALGYGLLPLAHDFLSLALICGLVIVPVGLWSTRQPLAILLLAITFSNINLQATYTPWDFGFFLDSISASMIGIMVGHICLTAIRSMGSAHLLARFFALEKRDIRALARQAGPNSLEGYVNRSLDRAASMAIRIKPGQGDQDQSTRLLVWLRLGAAVARIRQALRRVGGQRRRACESLLAQVCAELDEDTPGFGREFEQRLDQALAIAARRSRHTRDDLLLGLIGLRLAVRALRSNAGELAPPGSLPTDTTAGQAPAIREMPI